MRNIGVGLLAATLVTTGLWACGGDDTSDGDGSGGSGNAAGSAGSGAGAGGSAGTGGDGGSANAGGGGSGNAGGSGGGAGSAGSGGQDGGSDASTGGSAGAPIDAGPDSAFGPGSSDPYPPVPYPPENQHTPTKATLGKILFWEEQIGEADDMACGTCHRSAAGGSDPRAAELLSRHPGVDDTLGTADDIHGARGVERCTESGGVITPTTDPIFGTNPQVTKRKPPSYLDAMFAPDIFWDGRATTTFTDPDTGMVAIPLGGGLESQSVGPPTSSVEMACDNQTWTDIHTKLQTVTPLALATNLPPDMKAAITDADGGTKTYPDLFGEAFGTPDINTKRIAFAIATHERRLTSKLTPWDLWNAGDTSAMSANQAKGFELYMRNDKGRCAVCHPPPLFTDHSFRNIGFHVEWSGDLGREEHTGQASDRGKFKTPGLRNVGLREAAGLLHDGIGHGASLEAVMKAYNQPPSLSANVDVNIKILGLTQEEIDLIVDFMRNALTDPRVAAEQTPFDRPKLSTEP